jgi:hypothetical protein
MAIKTRTRAEVYKLWIKALRSGKYKQTDCILRRGDAFCCLGVLCDLARKDGGPGWAATVSHSYLEQGHGGLLPDAMNRFLALGGATGALAKMNDGGRSFTEIAHYIEVEVMPKALRGSNE